MGRRILLLLGIGALLGAALIAAPGRGTAAPASAAAGEANPSPPARSGRQLEVRVTPRMLRYSRTRYALYFAGALWSSLALLLLLRTGFSARLRDIAERRTQNPILRAFIFYPLLALASALLLLPLTFYASYLLPHQYGLSTQSPAAWLLDRARSLGVTALVGSAVVALLLATLRRSPRLWWFWFWLASIPLLTLAILLAPVLLDPLFNRFRPLPDPALRDRLLSLAARAGIEHSRVFEVDASRRTRTLNAYVTGLGGTARIVLWDTLLERLDEEEVVAVMAHEMGHYVERHVPLGLLASIAGSLGVLLLVDRGGRRLIARYGAAWRLRGLDDLAALPVLLLLIRLVNFFGSPVETAISRTMERRADHFALRLTGNGEAAASAFIKLSEGNLSHPDPPRFIELWMFTHPPLRERIRTALDWEGTSAREPRPDPEPSP